MPGQIPLCHGTGEGVGYHRRARGAVESRQSAASQAPDEAKALQRQNEPQHEWSQYRTPRRCTVWRLWSWTGIGFLHLFHRSRMAFLDAYQDLVLGEPASAVSEPLKSAILSLRRTAESE